MMNEHTNPSNSNPNPRHSEQENQEELVSKRPEEPVDRGVAHHHHYYYGEPAGAAAKTAPDRKPWYNQGWMWLIVAVIGIGAVLLMLSMLTNQVGGVGEAVREQTGAIREQTGILGSIQQSLNEMSAGLSRSMEEISAGIGRIEQAIRDGMNMLLSVFK